MTPKLDVWVDESVEGLADRFEHGILNAPPEFGLRILGVGFALSYKNFMVVAPSFAIVEALKKQFSTIDGVWVNEYPPEVAFAIALELELEQ